MCSGRKLVGDKGTVIIRVWSDCDMGLGSRFTPTRQLYSSSLFNLCRDFTQRLHLAAIAQYPPYSLTGFRGSLFLADEENEMIERE